MDSTLVKPPQSSFIPGEIIIRLSAEGHRQAQRRHAAVPLSDDVSLGRLEGAQSLGLNVIRRVFAEHDLPVAITRPIKPRSYSLTSEARPLLARDFLHHERKSKFSDLYVLQSEEVSEPQLFELSRQLVLESQGFIEAALPRKAVYSFQKPDSMFYPYQWGLWRIGCEEAWTTQTGREEVVVAVLDSGVSTHSDLDPNLLTGSDQVTSRVKSNPLPPGWFFDPEPVRLLNSTDDDEAHGTHVAGIIGARGKPGYGVAGVVWNCKILPVRCLARIVNQNGQSTNVGHPDDIANAIVWAADNGAKVLNLSLGSEGISMGYSIEGDPAQKAAIEYAQSQGCLVIAAVGNNSTRWPYFPASFPDVIGVGAVDWDDRHAGFSNWGDQVDVVAPGVDIFSTSLGNHFAMANGTSQAAPHVSGLAAMLFSQSATASAGDVTKAIYDSACRLTDQSPTNPTGKHEYYGWGRINAKQALAAI
jgi:subtilisin family serine protease